MPSTVIKPARDRDEYVIWSTVTESPHAYGSRGEVAALLADGIRSGPEDPEPVLVRTDANGSSSLGGYPEGLWDDDCYIYKQSGVLPRRHLWQAAVWQCEGRVRDILDLLEPFEDEDGPGILERRKAETVNGPLTSGVRIAESEIRLAGAALGALKREIESWNTR